MATKKTSTPETKDEAPASEAPKAPTGITVETQEDVTDLDGEARASVDPYNRKPKASSVEIDGGVVVETFV